MDQDKRLHFRLYTDIACTLHLPAGETLSARIVNLSAGGLLFSCGREIFHRIVPREQRTPGQVKGIVIRVRFDLQPPSHPLLSIDASARVIHSERLAQDIFHVGVQFLDLDETTTHALSASLNAMYAQPQS